MLYEKTHVNNHSLHVLYRLIHAIAMDTIYACIMMSGSIARAPNLSSTGKNHANDRFFRF